MFILRCICDTNTSLDKLASKSHSKPSLVCIPDTAKWSSMQSLASLQESVFDNGNQISFCSFNSRCTTACFFLLIVCVAFFIIAFVIDSHASMEDLAMLSALSARSKDTSFIFSTILHELIHANEEVVRNKTFLAVKTLMQSMEVNILSNE